MKTTEIDDITIHKAHCDWIVKQAMELKALFSHNSERMVELNKSRALADIETIKNSLSELQLYVENLQEENNMKIENGKRYRFNTTDSELRKYNGTEVEVIRPLTEDEADIFDVGNMYKVRFADGYERDAFEDELSLQIQDLIVEMEELL